jgi:DNA-binding IclR family transcriptional regulator
MHRSISEELFMSADGDSRDKRVEPEHAPRARQAAGSTVKSAARAMDVLQFLSSRVRPVPTMAIAEACGIPKSSTYSLLNAMLERHWITYFEADRGWGLGSAVFETAAAYLRSRPLERLGRPVLQRLTGRTGETSHLAVLRGSDVLYLDKQVPAMSRVRLVTEVGVQLPAHLTSVGRAMLAALPPAQIRALYVHPLLVRRTDRGPLTVGRLLDDLREVKTRGYALEIGMTTPGIGCIGAAALSHEGYPSAAVGLTFVAARRGEDARAALAHAVMHAAAELGRAVGVRESEIADAALESRS